LSRKIYFIITVTSFLNFYVPAVVFLSVLTEETVFDESAAAVATLNGGRSGITVRE
jgi:hypothetical protein